MPVISSYTLRRLLEPLREKGADRNVALESRVVQSVDYDPETEELTIEFVQRGTYKYKSVPLDTYVDLATAESQGRYFNLYIRNAGFQYERIS